MDNSTETRQNWGLLDRRDADRQAEFHVPNPAFVIRCLELAAPPLGAGALAIVTIIAWTTLAISTYGWHRARVVKVPSRGRRMMEEQE